MDSLRKIALQQPTPRFACPSLEGTSDGPMVLYQINLIRIVSDLSVIANSGDLWYQTRRIN